MNNCAGKPKFTHLTHMQRSQVEVLHNRNIVQTAIAHDVGVHQSTVSRELSLHSIGDVYDAGLAHQLAEQKLHTPVSLPVLDTCPELVEHLIHHMRNKRSITQALHLIYRQYPDLPTVCAETVYRWAYSTDSCEARLICTLLVRPRKKRRTRRGKPTNKGKLRNQTNISARSEKANLRTEFGHWEGDLVIGKAGKTAIATLVERKTRYTIIIPLVIKTSEEVVGQIVQAFSHLPPEAVRSLTWDNGKEMAQHEMLAELANIDVYFADPHSPWQRGSNENTNGLVRRWYPKGVDLGAVSVNEWEKVQTWLNTRPMQVLSWDTPEKLFQKHLEQLAGMQ